MSSPYGWGLIGPGRFAREFADELRRAGRAKCVSVASRNIEKSSSFANEFGFTRAYGSYEEIVTDNEVDIIYVVVPHVFHRKIAEMALNAGKAVLCEKPLTTSFADSKALIELARERGLFLMEAMKTGFLPAIKQAKKWIDSGEIGDPKILKADFCFSGPSDPEDRLMNASLGGGALLDVGVYPVFLAQHLFGDIESAQAEGTLTHTGVEDSCVISTRHRSGGIGALSCSFRSNDEAMDATILGTEGSIEIPVFHKANRAILRRNGTPVETYQADQSGMVYAEIESVMDALDHNLIECPGHTHSDTLNLAKTIDQIRSAILQQGEIP